MLCVLFITHHFLINPWHPIAMTLAQQGTAANADLLVGDIYGGDYSEFQLPADLVAASLGKLCRPNARKKVSKADLARAVLDMITNNVGSLARLLAKQHSVTHVVFVGSFLNSNQLSIARLAYAMDFWSGGKLQALFLKHEGYFGTFGALAWTAANSACAPAEPRQ
eukprot:m.88484 g.88484  ORF g.88484 m.88484 type:complete len:166 (+) comp12862_c0_seq1:140-637(+)